MVLESRYTVDTDRRQRGEVQRASMLSNPVCAFRLAPHSVFVPAVAASIHASAASPKVPNWANWTRRVPSVRNLAKRCCSDQDASGGVVRSPGDRNDRPESTLEQPIAGGKPWTSDRVYGKLVFVYNAGRPRRATVL